MPTLLLSGDSNNNRNIHADNASLATTTTDLVRQLEQGSIEAAYKLASLTEYKHDGGCYNCDTIANYYLMAFRFVRNDDSIKCNPLLLSLVQQSIQLLLCHVDVSRIQHLPWLPTLMSELRELGKRIKDESSEADRLVSLPNVQVSYPLCVDNSINGEYGRAIRISIYHCRALLCEDMDTSKSISYYRKCLSVRPSRVESQRLQQSAKIALQHLITDEEKYAAATMDYRPKLPSRTSSVSSGASSSCSMACANCGVEKRGMPVCARCKSQYYCGIRCLKAHKPVHDLECCSSISH